MLRKILFILVFSLSIGGLSAQNIVFKRVEQPIQIDGEIDEAWNLADSAYNWVQYFPFDSSLAVNQSVAKVLFDDKNIYVLGILYSNNQDRKYVTPSLRRDFRGAANDNFTVIFDTFQDRTNAFTFGINPFGVRREGLVANGGTGESSFSLDWDNVWKGEAKQYRGYWVAEMAIPLNSLRFNEGQKEWNINFYRIDSESAERSTWAPISRNFTLFNLAVLRVAQWEEPTKKSGKNLSFIPYISGNSSKNFENKTDAVTGFNAGFDIKYGITPGLNLDLTVNPDFSQVEVDQQVTNLDRFEIFFPERRQFFLENGDLFANFGYSTIRPFFSRRIGLNAPIQFGARLSGKINKDWRIGAMNMQTGEVESDGLPSQNFTVLALQRQVGARSNITGILINKQSLNYDPDPKSEHPLYSQFNRNAGLEYNLASSNNLWTGKAMVLKSFGPDGTQEGFVHAANLKYASGNLSWNWQHEYVSENYTAEVGFVPRNGFYKISPTVAYRWFPKSEKILSHGPDVGTTFFFNTTGQQTDKIINAAYSVRWRSQSNLTVWMGHDFVRLQRPFDPTNFSGETLPAGSIHKWNSLGAEYNSKPQSLFTYSFSTRMGGYYADGDRFNISSELGYRFQPFVSIAMSSNYNRIVLPEPWNTTNFWLVGPRLDITMTNTVFFTAFVQYNEQIENINLNTRFQWRFKPASDLFIVYTDNYLPAPFYTKNRSIVLKFTYWWNV
jgi:hypothetical protein